MKWTENSMSLAWKFVQCCFDCRRYCACKRTSGNCTCNCLPWAGHPVLPVSIADVNYLSCKMALYMGSGGSPAHGKQLHVQLSIITPNTRKLTQTHVNSRKHTANARKHRPRTHANTVQLPKPLFRSNKSSKGDIYIYIHKFHS